jgi:type III secretion system YscQ/HrcQ family protein
MRAAPYPYERWPKLSRGAAAVASGLARIAVHADGSLGARVIEALASTLGTDPHIAPGPARAWRAAELRAELREPLVAIELLVRLDGVDHGVVLELTSELCHALLERTLGGDGAGARAPGVPLDELELGAVGYVAARAAAVTGTLRVQNVTGSCAAVLDAVDRVADGQVIVWPLQLSIGNSGGAARVLLAESVGLAWLRAAAPARRVDVPSALLGLPVQLCAHAATVRLTACELAALEPGDVVVPERTQLTRDEHGFHGGAQLHAIGQRGGAHARCQLEQHTLRIEELEQGEHAMNDETNPDALVKDAPIELCVELARFTVRLEDVLGLRVGEVWSTGSAIGERVVLTANGRPIARGELVDIDGEVGVRILEKHG